MLHRRMTLRKELKILQKEKLKYYYWFQKGMLIKIFPMNLKLQNELWKIMCQVFLEKLMLMIEHRLLFLRLKILNYSKMMVSCDVSRETFLIKELAKIMFHVKRSDTKWTNNVSRETFNKTMEITIQKCYNIWA